VVGDPGDDRLSRRGHYHGPGGLNGRVRDGNGWDPAGIVAGNAPGRRSGRPGTLERCERARDNRWPVTHSIRARQGFGHRPSRPRIADPPGRTTSARGCRRGVPSPGRRGPSRGPGAGGSGWSSYRLLGPVRYGGRPPYTPGPSTWSSSRSLRSNCCRKPRLGGGFALRCLQRLSGPDLATRRCPERDSRHTRGRSSPILSY
jgi:hypothetical protein